MNREAIEGAINYKLKTEERIKELDKEGESYRLAHENFLDLLDKAEKREAALREALDTIKHEARYRLKSSKDDTWALIFNKARAALEVK